jgi:heptosyltransferase-1
MHLLIVKMTSLGDVVHMLPALTEATHHVPDLHADWVAEQGFDVIPSWHPAVRRVIPSALRRWRKHLGLAATWCEISLFRAAVRQEKYDLVLDAQGLLKSAAVTRMARGPVAGLDARSAREPLASWFYGARFPAPRTLHAITRNRLLMAQALGYAMGEETDIRYGLNAPERVDVPGLAGDYVLCLHGTARPEKEYPEADWVRLLQQIAARGFGVALPWGNERERLRAERLAVALPAAVVLPKMGLADLAGVIAGARAVLGVDTGLMHLAAAFRRPGVGLYPATPPERFGARNEADAPAMVNLSGEAALRPDRVLQVFTATLSID